MYRPHVTRLFVLVVFCATALLAGRAKAADSVSTVTRSTPAGLDDPERTRALFR